MKRLILTCILLSAAYLLSAEYCWISINAPVSGYRIGDDGIWFRFEQKPSVINTGHYRMHAFISKNNAQYKDFVALIMLSHSTSIPIKVLWYDDGLLGGKLDVMDVDMIEM